MTVGDIISEPIRVNKLQPANKVDERVSYLLNAVGLSANCRNRYAHEFSGGQRQRIGIARALAMEPKLIVCDEPVSALDVSVQAQVLNLLSDLCDEFGLTYLFIAHGLNVVKHVSDRVGVMYLGRLVEVAASASSTGTRCTPTPRRSSRRSRSRIRRSARSASCWRGPWAARSTLRPAAGSPSRCYAKGGCVGLRLRHRDARAGRGLAGPLRVVLPL